MRPENKKRQIKKAILSRSSGFTLTELVITMGLFGIGALSLAVVMRYNMDFFTGVQKSYEALAMVEEARIALADPVTCKGNFSGETFQPGHVLDLTRKKMVYYDGSGKTDSVFLADSKTSGAKLESLKMEVLSEVDSEVGTDRKEYVGMLQFEFSTPGTSNQTRKTRSSEFPLLVSTEGKKIVSCVSMSGVRFGEGEMGPITKGKVCDLMSDGLYYYSEKTDQCVPFESKVFSGTEYLASCPGNWSPAGSDGHTACGYSASDPARGNYLSPPRTYKTADGKSVTYQAKPDRALYFLDIAAKECTCHPAAEVVGGLCNISCVNLESRQ